MAFIASIVPATLYYVALFIQVDLEAARNDIQPLDPSEIPKLSTVLREGWYFVIPFIVLTRVKPATPKPKMPLATITMPRILRR
mgnify:CR=1 FL=1